MKVKLGREKLPRRPFDLSHDVHTTLEWGFMQPTCKIEMVAGSTINCNVGTFCRLVPLVAPTFGRATIKHYAYFVPLRQVCMQFENLITRTGYTGGETTYIPRFVLHSNLNDLCSMLLSPEACHTFIFTATKSYISQTNRAQYQNVTEAEANRAAALQALKTSLALTANAYDVTATTHGDHDIDLQGCDYILDCGNGNNYVVGVRLTSYGRRLRKILIGLGYQINFKETVKVSFLPLLAYYKAYFELFAIKQKVNWQYTSAFKLIQFSANKNATNAFGASPSGIATLTKAFISDLAQCFYSFNVDYYTANQYELNYHMSNEVLKSVEFFDNGDADTASLTASNSDTSFDEVQDAIFGISIKSLLKFLPFVNKDSVLGQRVKDKMRVHGFGTADDDKESHFIGASSVNIDISDVMSNADTLTEDGGKDLGDYVGKGVGSGRSGSMKYSSSCPGYFIILSTVVPRTGYCQGIDPNLFHGTRDVFDWYTPQFDALGMQVTNGVELLCASDYFRKTSPSHASNFGVIPRYSEYKCAAASQDILNGDMSLMSRRTELLPYTLTRYFPVSDFTFNTNSGRTVGFVVNENYVPIVNESLRYLGKTDLFGNFNRIFQSVGMEQVGPDVTSSEYDGFIMHNILDIKLIAPMKPMSESYDTDAYEDAVSVNKA